MFGWWWNIPIFKIRIEVQRELKIIVDPRNGSPHLDLDDEAHLFPVV